LTIGTDANPVQAGVRAEIVIHADGGPVTSAANIAEDPNFLGHGVVTHGTVRIAGQDKADFLKAVVHPEAGDSALTFAEAPTGWQVGDKLVVAAASNQMNQATQQIETYEDEVVTIKAITANADGTYTVALDQVLQYDHVPPTHQSDAVLQIPVANYTRNVFIGSETEEGAYLGDGNSVPIDERGHVMFMHNDDVEVLNAEFFELGRTDKSILIEKAVDTLRDQLAAGEIKSNFVDDVEDFLATEGSASEHNVAGRYALHFHRTGTNDLDNPAIAEGNAIWGSPGWGIVHHDANVDIVSNAVFGVVGGGIVAEAGNETGIWSDNIVIQTTGLVDGASFNAESSGDPFHPDYVADTLDDTFRQGEAFAMKSRLLEVTGNVVASANGTGFSFWPHGVEGASHIDSGVDAYTYEQGYDPFYGQTDVNAAIVPTRDFFANEVIGSRHALNTSSNKTDHEHDLDVLVEDLLAWNVDQAIISFYQQNYIIKDSVFIKGEGNTDRFESGGFIGQNGAATHIHDPLDFKLVNNYWEGWDVVLREPAEIIVGNTVVGSTITQETGAAGIFREGFTADNDTIDYLDNSANWIESLPNPIGTIEASVNVAKSDLVMDAWFDSFLVYVEKTDTIGDQVRTFGSGRDSGFRGASQKTWWEENAANNGYFERDGKIFLIVELAVGDRITGSVGTTEVAIELRFLETEPERLPAGAASNGALPDRFDADGIGEFRVVDQRVIGASGNQLTATDPADDAGGQDTGSDTTGGTHGHTNTAPVATNDSGFSIEVGQSLDIAVADLLANDSDADGDALSLALGAVTGGSAERLVVNGTDTIRFTADAAGTAQFTYTASDGQGGTDTATVTVEVNAPTPPTEQESETADSTVLMSEEFDTAPAGADTVASSLLLDGGGVALARGSDSGTTVFIPVDVTGRTGVMASITMRAPSEGSFDAGGAYRDFIRIEVVYDGGTVTLLDDLPFNRDAGAFVSPVTGNKVGDAVAILEYALDSASTAELRITTHVTGDDETIEIDVVEITADPVEEPAEPPAPPLNTVPVASDDSGFSVEAGQSLDIA
ncbi:MAG: Ig-like domain-containing protein, partial [Pseudomonadota bacterium]